MVYKTICEKLKYNMTIHENVFNSNEDSSKGGRPPSFSFNFFVD